MPYTSKRISIVDAEIPDSVTIIQPVNLYGCALGENVFIGPFVEIQKDAVIGDSTKIQSHSFICELVSIGSECFNRTWGHVYKRSVCRWSARGRR